jgi:hypothetical protein
VSSKINTVIPQYLWGFFSGATLDGGEPKIVLLIERRDGLTAMKIINIL